MLHFIMLLIVNIEERKVELITVTTEGTPTDVVKLPSLGKFVICKKNDVFFVALFAVQLFHTDIAQRLTEKEMEFVGAGIFGRIPGNTPSADFQSGTCNKFFGFYKPADLKLAQEILDSIVKILTEASLRHPTP